jgi:hypothetical protein
MIRILLVFVFAAVFAQAQPEVHYVWDLVSPAYAHPEEYTNRTTGHFGRKFVGVAKRRFFPNPVTPKVLRGRQEPCVIKAALLVDKYGKVEDVAILGQTPADVVDEPILDFFRRFVFAEQREDKKAIEFETELVLIFKPAPAK